MFDWRALLMKLCCHAVCEVLKMESSSISFMTPLGVSNDALQEVAGCQMQQRRAKVLPYLVIEAPGQPHYL